MKKALQAISFWHLIPAAAYGLFYLLWFDYLEEMPQREYIMLGNSLDASIPFLEVFVVPYLSWFFFMLFWGILLNFTDRDAYDRMITMCMIGMTLFLIVSTIVPTALDLRPHYIGRYNVFTRMCRSLWTIDTPTNVWPSIHVFNTAAITVSVLRSRFFENANLMHRAFIVIWAALIILSTVFIKQHSLLDVLAGGILAVVATLIVWDLNYVARFRRWDAFVARRLAARAKKRTVL